jgi:hypothetical protein
MNVNVEDHLPRFPATLPQGPPQDSGITDIGKKDEGGFHPPVEEWKPPEEEEKQSSVLNTTSVEVKESGCMEREKRDAKRLLRAIKKIEYNVLRRRKEGRKPRKQRPGFIYPWKAQSALNIWRAGTGRGKSSTRQHERTSRGSH